jgi:GTP-binding protein
VGTIVTDASSDVVLADIARPGDRVPIARGGRGGRGNARFASSTNRAPTRHDPGGEGEQRQLRLELKLLADVGLVGMPNAGKSTFLSRVSAARPKIADYPFTTLAPSLGVARAGDDRTLVIADIPGLIEGAHQGTGLGDRFLRHIERCRVLLHLVDPTAPGFSFANAIDTIDRELALYSPVLAEKPQILVLTKKDALQDDDVVRDAELEARRQRRPLFVVSAVTGEGLSPLLRAAADEVARLVRPTGGEERHP